jgi:hypothetical protein
MCLSLLIHRLEWKRDARWLEHVRLDVLCPLSLCVGPHQDCTLATLLRQLLKEHHCSKHCRSDVG